ncbi:hypothetical protein EYZ11_009911 [Aspergillus tanneri]|uniref:Uncharacterized protein n=1 Tax=Aspergillus tanneri TaxID=1220188 RepID=A0A4S3J763_9EURO|nr:uncharacterized protein ATNIH1004_000785 [Aspergillus tanneri]KAA8651887.1 hypothetical protein ATNIH1004_000785 [Aspergillus tanneri]THC90632.1 hypothetical protein EYZ11_009911 [Aspergillus tanneri]
MSGVYDLQKKYDDLPDKRRYWPTPAGSAEPHSSLWNGLRHYTAQRLTSEDQNRRVFYEGTTADEILDTNSTRIGIGYWTKCVAGRGVLIDYLS